MKKFYFLVPLLSFVLGSKPLLSDEIYFWDIGSVSNGKQTKTIKKYTPATNETTIMLNYESTNRGTTGKSTIFDAYENKIYLIGSCGSGNNNCFDIYDVENNSVTFDLTGVNGAGGTAVRIPNGIVKDSNGIVKVGGDANEIHIGENSWITKEENGRQKVYAKDGAGNAIPIDYTNGTKLLINGRDVEQSINNVGALSAALTGLPTVPTDTNLACGLGTGTHGGDYAFSGGCASRVNDNLSINYAASMTMPGQDYAGDFEDKFSARAGFVWKLGKSNKPTQISLKAKEKMEAKIFSLEKSNKEIISQNEDLKQKNQSIISQNKSLLVRLERLEKIALSKTKSQDLATIKLP